MNIDWQETLNFFQIIESLFTTLGIIVGGIWVYFNFFKSRLYKPRLELEVAGTPFHREGIYYLKIVLQLKNLGLSNFVIEQEGTALLVSPLFAGDNTLNEGEPNVLEVFMKHEWIEPDEQIEEHHILILEKTNQIALKLWLRIVSKKGRIQTEWNETKLIEIPELHQRPDTPMINTRKVIAEESPSTSER